MFSLSHKKEIAVLARKDRVDASYELVPIRVLKRFGQHLIRAFCDLGRPNNCEHVTELNSLQIQGGPIFTSWEPPPESSQNMPKETEWNPMEPIESISFLPLSIVNFKDSIRVERKIVQLSQRNAFFNVPAPNICTACEASRIEESRNIQKGIVLCSEGPCSMRVEIFHCSDCSHRIHSEGRVDKIVLLTLSTAAAHVMLRNQLTGVALSNGTLTGRLGQYHSQSLANISAGLVPGTFLSYLTCQEKHQLCHD